MKQLAFRMHLLTMAASIFLLLPAAAQQIGLGISEQAAANSFPLVASGRLANLLTDSTDASVVQIAAKTFCNDIALLTGIYAIQIDDGPLQITDTKTVGRSEAWKQNVLANRTVRQWPLGQLSAGVHTLHVYAIDPGVILDEIRINWGGLPSAYSLLPQTKVAE